MAVSLDTLVNSSENVRLEECPALDGTTAWKIFVGDMTLDEYLFSQKPEGYEKWELDSGNEYMVAIHERKYYRGGPDMYAVDVGVEIMGFVNSTMFRFDASLSGQTYPSSEEPDMDFKISGAEGAFETGADYEDFCERIQEHLNENYRFSIGYE